MRTVLVCAVAPQTTCGGGLGTCSLGSCGQCGAPGQACCRPTGGGARFCTAADTACNPNNDQCEACGGAGQACCAGNVCNGGGCCDQNSGQCVAANATCPMGGTCTTGGCGPSCGRLGQPPCAGDIGCTAPYTVEQNGRCVACGGGDQRCCAGSNGGLCDAPYECGMNDTCQPCGGAMQLCCGGRFCASGTCNNGRCP